MENTKTQRIKLAISYVISEGKAENQEDLGRKLGINNKSYLSQIVNGRVNSDDFINKLIRLEGRIDKNWLLTGEGEMLLGTQEKQSGKPVKGYALGVPYYNVDFIGGFDLVINDQTVRPEYLIDFQQYNKATCWCNITGHSMEPEITSGDIIALKEIADPSFLPYGEIYAIITTNGMRTIKRIGPASDPEHYALIPTNKSPEYGVQEIPRSMILKVYEVLGCMKKL